MTKYFSRFYAKLRSLEEGKHLPPRFSFAVKDLAKHLGVLDKPVVAARSSVSSELSFRAALNSREGSVCSRGPDYSSLEDTVCVKTQKPSASPVSFFERVSCSTTTGSSKNARWRPRNPLKRPPRRSFFPGKPSRRVSIAAEPLRFAQGQPRTTTKSAAPFNSHWAESLLAAQRGDDPRDQTPKPADFSGFSTPGTPGGGTAKQRPSVNRSFLGRYSKDKITPAAAAAEGDRRFVRIRVCDRRRPRDKATYRIVQHVCRQNEDVAAATIVFPTKESNYYSNK